MLTIVFRDNGIVFGQDLGLLQQPEVSEHSSGFLDLGYSSFHQGHSEGFSVTGATFNTLLDSSQTWIWDPSIQFSWS
jgi:hypothetical protein